MEVLNEMSPDCLWWERTYGPLSVISGAVNAFRNGMRCVILVVDKNIAYRHELRQVIYRNLCSLKSNIRIVNVDCEEIVNLGIDLSKGLLKELVDEDAILKRGESVIEYADKTGALKDKFIYIKGVDKEQTCAEAIAIANELCRKHTQSGAHIIIETPFVPTGYLAKNAVVINVTEQIGEADMETFASLYYRSRYKDSLRKKYIVNRYVEFVIACVCGTDAELAVALIDDLDFINGSVLESLKNISLNGCVHGMRGSDAGSGRNPHPLFLLKSGRVDDIERLVWTAQLQTFFPVIEEKRWFYIDKYRSELERILSTVEIYDSNIKKRITEVEDLDIGRLCYSMSKDKEAFIEYDYDEVVFLKNMRNNIAHLDLLSPRELSRLIEIAE